MELFHIGQTQLQNLIFAFIVGAIGSAAYITALFFKFVGETEENRKLVTKPFLDSQSKNAGWVKIIWYCIIGGLIASIFQYDVPNFVSIQSLILGATWPAIVSQFLSGRMANPTQREIDELNTLESSSIKTSEIQNWIKLKAKVSKK